MAVSEHVNAGVTASTSFDKYLELIEKKTSKELPFRSRLLALNKLRVNSKHYGLAPAKSETDGLPITIREFFDEVSKAILGKPLSSISLVGLLRESEIKALLIEAETSFEAGAYSDALVACRKAIYQRFEWMYDISKYSKEPVPVLFFSRAPYYTRNKEYIDKHVREATDFVVLDHSEIELELVKEGIDSVSFWNVWRLTPDIHRSPETKEWVVKNDLEKFDPEGIRERTEYVLDTTISLFLAADQRFLVTKWIEKNKRYFIRLKREQVPIYGKADKTSYEIAKTPIGLRELHVDFSIPALNGGGTFWHVSHIELELHLWGFIDADEIEEGE